MFFDGNRRWAKERSLNPMEGHAAGYKKAVEFTDWCIARDIKCFTGYGFSTENWNRSPQEVSYLMKLLEAGLLEQFERHGSKEKGARIRVLGQRERLPESLQRAIQKVEEGTRNNGKFFLNLAVSYGGKWDIVQAAQKMQRERKEITEEAFPQYLSTAGLPAPDLMIRFGGEQRLSNFLLWQQAYTELYFVKKYWPDVTEQDLDEAIVEYQKRQRRFGR